MLDSEAHDVMDLLGGRGGEDRFGYVIGDGRLMDTDLPTSVHWAYVDSDDSGRSGVFEVTSPDRYAASSYDLRPLRVEGQQVIVSGSPEGVAQALNAIFENAWVAVPVSLISPVRRLFRHVRTKESWQSPDAWLPSRVGPWAELVLRIGQHCIFRPMERDVDGLPVAWQPDAYMQHYVAMRSAHRRVVTLLRDGSGTA